MPGPTPLPPGDLEVLEFERVQFRHAGARISAIRERFGLTEPRYTQRLVRIIRDPAAVAYDPVHVNRLLRLEERRRSMRARTR